MDLEKMGLYFVHWNTKSKDQGPENFKSIPQKDNHTAQFNFKVPKKVLI